MRLRHSCVEPSSKAHQTARQPLNAARDESAPGTLPYTRLTNATHTQYNGESTIRPAAQHSCPCLLAAHGPCWPPRSEGDRTQNRYDTRSRTTTSCKPASTPRCRPEFRTRRRPSTSGCEDPEPHTSPLSPRPRPAMICVPWLFDKTKPAPAQPNHPACSNAYALPESRVSLLACAARCGIQIQSCRRRGKSSSRDCRHTARSCHGKRAAVVSKWSPRRCTVRARRPPRS